MCVVTWREVAVGTLLLVVSLTLSLTELGPWVGKILWRVYSPSSDRLGTKFNVQ